MSRHKLLAVAFVGLVVGLGGAGLTAQTPTPQARNTINEIRRELLQLPYYGVFDFMAFKYDKGTVTLQGCPRRTAEGRRGTGGQAGVRRRSGRRPDRGPAHVDGRR